MPCLLRGVSTTTDAHTIDHSPVLEVAADFDAMLVERLEPTIAALRQRGPKPTAALVAHRVDAGESDEPTDCGVVDIQPSSSLLNRPTQMAMLRCDAELAKIRETEPIDRSLPDSREMVELLSLRHMLGGGKLRRLARLSPTQNDELELSWKGDVAKGSQVGVAAGLLAARRRLALDAAAAHLADHRSHDHSSRRLEAAAGAGCSRPHRAPSRA